MPTDEEEIRKKSGVTQSTKNHAMCICLFAFNLSSVYNCLPVLKSTTTALRYFNSKYCTIELPN